MTPESVYSEILRGPGAIKEELRRINSDIELYEADNGQLYLEEGPYFKDLSPNAIDNLRRLSPGAENKEIREALLS